MTTHGDESGLLPIRVVQGLDIVGPADAFTGAQLAEAGKMTSPYEVVLLGLTSKPVISESGIIFQPKCSVGNSPKLDTLIVPGGAGVRTEPKIQATVAKWVQS